MALITLRERRRRAGRWFLIRVGMLLLLMGLLAYSAWFAPWAKPVRHVPIETTR